MATDFEITDTVYFREFFAGEVTVIADGRPVDETGLVDEFKLSQQYIPPNGKYEHGLVFFRASVSPEYRGLPTAIGDDVTTVEFTAEVINTKKDEYHRINLRDPDDGTKHGILTLRPEFAPAGYTEKGETYPIVVQIEYDHEQTKEVRGYSDERIERKREAALDAIEEFQQYV